MILENIHIRKTFLLKIGSASIILHNTILTTAVNPKFGIKQVTKFISISRAEIFKYVNDRPTGCSIANLFV